MTQSYPHSPTPASVPVCPRHPDRVSYVRCQRCDRPVCPECQVPGAVGVHCVDCVRQARSSRPARRTVLGGVSVAADTRLTMILVAACVVVYVGQKVFPSLVSDFGFAPVVALSQPWRFATTAFLHGSIMHLAFNMWALLVCGAVVEPILGRWRFLTLYTLSALGGSTAIYLLTSPASTAWYGLTVGASGAVFGLFAAIFVIQRRFGRDTSAIVGLLVINLVVSFVGSGISWQGHVGGLITGGALAAIYAWAPRGRRTPASVAGSIAVAALLVALVVARAATLA